MQQRDGNKNRTPREIEEQLERDRAHLEASLGALRAKFTQKNLLAEAQSFVVSNAEHHLKTLDMVVRRNPLAVALAGAGLAWLILGRASSKAASKAAKKAAKHPPLAPQVQAINEWEGEGGTSLPEPELQDHDDDAWLAQAESLRRRAVRKLARLEEAARDRLAPAASVAKAKAAVVSQLASDVRRSMASGLGSMPGSVRDGVLSARDAAWRAKIAATEGAAKSLEDHPMLSGSVALALGAAVASALPLSDVENRVLGEERDRMVEGAKRMIKSERDRAARIAASLATDLKTDVRRAGEQVTEAASKITGGDYPSMSDSERSGTPRHCTPAD